MRLLLQIGSFVGEDFVDDGALDVETNVDTIETGKFSTFAELELNAWETESVSALEDEGNSLDGVENLLARLAHQHYRSSSNFGQI